MKSVVVIMSLLLTASLAKALPIQETWSTGDARGKISLEFDGGGGVLVYQDMNSCKLNWAGGRTSVCTRMAILRIPDRAQLVREEDGTRLYSLPTSGFQLVEVGQRLNRPASLRLVKGETVRVLEFESSPLRSR